MSAQLEHALAGAQWIWAAGRQRGPLHAAAFRATFVTLNPLSPLRIHCTADSRYFLWLNGKLIGNGPARGAATAPYYDTHHIPPSRDRVYTLALLVIHYNKPSAIFHAVRAGFLCRVEDAQAETLCVSNHGWRARVADEYTGIESHLFAYEFDARHEPADWTQPSHDASRWRPAVPIMKSDLAAPDACLPRPIPPLTDDPQSPKRIYNLGVLVDSSPKPKRGEPVYTVLNRSERKPAPRGTFRPALPRFDPWPAKPVTIRPTPRHGHPFLELDFGHNTLAALDIEIEGRAGTTLEIAYAEWVRSNRVEATGEVFGTVINIMDRLVLKNGVTRHRFLQPRGFRFLLLAFTRMTGPVTIRRINAREQIYTTPNRAAFASSDERINRIYALSRRTINLCMEDSFTDCIHRERSAWLGDLQPEALFAYHAFAAYELARKSIRDYAGGNTPEGWIPGIYPTNNPFNLPTWGMRYARILWDYLLYSGDRETIAHCFPSLQKQMNWLRKYRRPDGLLSDKMPGWRFVDWTKTDAHDGDGAVQGWYLEALECAAKLARTLRRTRDAADYTRDARRLRASLPCHYWSKTKSAFLKYSPKLRRRPEWVAPGVTAQHENILFTLLAVGTPSMRRRALESIRGAAAAFLPNIGNYQSWNTVDVGQDGTLSGEETILLGTPFWSMYAIEALFTAGLDREALASIRICWGLMLDHGATTCWEMWDRNSSHCHGWSAGPVMLLPAYLLGVRPTAPGFRTFDVHPHPGDIAWAQATVPTPRGIIEAEWRRTPTRMILKILVPPGTSARILAPEGFAPPRPGPTRLGPGRHRLTFKSATRPR